MMDAGRFDRNAQSYYRCPIGRYHCNAMKDTIESTLKSLTLAIFLLSEKSNIEL
jgi:hypothetical protein